MMRNAWSTPLVACFVVSVLGACRDQPSTGSTLNPGSRAWERKEIVDWRYELNSPERVAEFQFTDDGLAFSTIGSRDGALAGPVFHWRIGTTGELTISDAPDGNEFATLSLISLQGTDATVWNEQRSQTERYTRTKIER